MAINSKDIDKNTFGKGLLVGTTELDDLQENVRGPINRIQRELIGAGLTSTAAPTVSISGASLTAQVTAASFVDGAGKGFGWDVTQDVDGSQSTHGAIIGATAPGAPSTLRYIVLAGISNEDEAIPKFDEDGFPYFFEQNSGFVIRVYQTADIATPDVIEDNTTLATLLSTIFNTDGAIPMFVLTRDFGATGFSASWEVSPRIFEQLSPIEERLSSRRFEGFASLPIIADADGVVAASANGVGGTGGNVDVTGGESIHIGWIDHSNNDRLKRIEVTVPAVTTSNFPSTTPGDTFIVRLKVDFDRTVTVYQGAGEYLVDSDFGLLATGTEGGSNQGSRPTLIDIPLIIATVVGSGSPPTLEFILNSARTNQGALIPYTALDTWANADALGSASVGTVITIQDAAEALITDLAQNETTVDGVDNGVDRIGASPLGGGLPFFLSQGVAPTLQELLVAIYSHIAINTNGSAFDLAAATTAGSTGFANLTRQHFHFNETWLGGHNVSRWDVVSDSEISFGDHNWHVWVTSFAGDETKGSAQKGETATAALQPATRTRPFGGGHLEVLNEAATVNHTWKLTLGDNASTTLRFMGYHPQATDFLKYVVNGVTATSSAGSIADGRFLFGFEESSELGVLSDTGTADVTGFYFFSRQDINSNWWASVKGTGVAEIMVDTGQICLSTTRRDMAIIVDAGEARFYIDGIVRAVISVPVEFYDVGYNPVFQIRRLDADESNALHFGAVALDVVSSS